MAGTNPGVAFRNMAMQRMLAAYVVAPNRVSAFSPTKGVDACVPTALAGKRNALHAVAQTLGATAIVTALFAAAPAWATHVSNPMRDTSNDGFGALVIIGVTCAQFSPLILEIFQEELHARDPMGIFLGALGLSIAPTCLTAALFIA